jgi:hypothetical protein
VLALDQVAQLGDLGGRAAGLVDVDRLDLEAADTLSIVGRGQLAGVDRLDRQLGGVPGWNLGPHHRRGRCRACGVIGEDRSVGR